MPVSCHTPHEQQTVPSPAQIRKHATQSKIPIARQAVWLLIGLPNAGKSSLFSRLTGLRQTILNFPGITVEVRAGICPLPDAKQITIIDTPGVYTLEEQEHTTPGAASEEIRLIRHLLTQRTFQEQLIQGIVFLLDASRLSMSFRLLREVQQFHLPIVPVLTHWDTLSQEALHQLKAILGNKVFWINSRTGHGIEEVKHHLAQCFERLPFKLCPAPLCTGCALWVHARQPQIPQTGSTRARTWTRKLDRFALHPFWGYVLLAGVLLLVFHVVFSVSAPLTELVEHGIQTLGNFLTQWSQPLSLWTHLIHGLLSATSAVLLFVPQIALLFLFMALLEDSGYLARMAALLDAPFRKLGLNGFSVVPLLTGIGCNIPALLSTRVVREPTVQQRLFWLIPFIPCSARYAVYVLLIGAFVPAYWIGPFHTQALALLALYGFSFIFIALASWVLTRWRTPPAASLPPVLELPPYQLPSWYTVGALTWSRLKEFLLRAGKMIFVIAIGLWLLGSVRLINTPPFIAFTDHVQESLLAQIGKTFAPLFTPLGFSWETVVALLSAFWAREVFLVTLGGLYGLGQPDSETQLTHTLPQLLAADPTWTTDTIIAFFVFFALALLCMSTLVMLAHLRGSWRKALFQGTITIGIAYFLAWLAKNIAMSIS